MMRASTEDLSKPILDFFLVSQDNLIINMKGVWNLAFELPSADTVLQKIKSMPSVRVITLDTSALEKWDSGLLTFILDIMKFCNTHNLSIDSTRLEAGIQRLINLAKAVPEKAGARRTIHKESFLSKIGSSTIEMFRSMSDILRFTGEVTLSLGRLLRGKAQLRISDVFLVMEDCGARALPIVTLLSMLIGLILAFVGAVQLLAFGAQIYVASLVAIGMIRIMGALITGIIMSGRTGAAFAAELGTMQVNEEIDAFTTMGISPIDFLILPRILGLSFMMPLLCIYANLMGIIGGAIVGIGMLGITITEYYNTTISAIRLSYIWIGLFHSVVFGILIGTAGCLRGIQCGRSASAVGIATTSAVVTSIVCVVVSTSIITLVCNVLGI